MILRASYAPSRSRKDLSVLSVEELAGSLEAHEQRRGKKHKPRDQAL